MSFSSGVKKELCYVDSGARHCDMGEIAAILNTCGEFSHSYIKIQTESAIVAKRVFLLIKKNFGIHSKITIRKNIKFKRSRVYCIEISEYSDKILQATGLWTQNKSGVIIHKQIDTNVTQSTCCKRAYIRGAFLAGGSVTDPSKSYHMEFVCQSSVLARGLSNIINFFELQAKAIQRKGHYIVYLKKGGNIVDLLNIMGAHTSLMDLENLRIVKDVCNNVNRFVNCETANLIKTVDAAVKQIEDIRLIMECKGLDSLSEQLAEVARVRIQYPEASLKEIGAMLSPSVGKSGVNHRLRKISDIAAMLKQG